jgi:hypothetical protein
MNVYSVRLYNCMYYLSQNVVITYFLYYSYNVPMINIAVSPKFQFLGKLLFCPEGYLVSVTAVYKVLSVRSLFNYGIYYSFAGTTTSTRLEVPPRAGKRVPRY